MGRRVLSQGQCCCVDSDTPVQPPAGMLHCEGGLIAGYKVSTIWEPARLCKRFDRRQFVSTPPIVSTTVLLRKRPKPLFSTFCAFIL